MATKRAPRHYRIEDREAFEREETEEESLDLPKETSAEVQGSPTAPEGGFNAATKPSEASGYEVGYKPDSMRGPAEKGRSASEHIGAAKAMATRESEAEKTPESATAFWGKPGASDGVWEGSAHTSEFTPAPRSEPAGVSSPAPKSMHVTSRDSVAGYEAAASTYGGHESTPYPVEERDAIAYSAPDPEDELDTGEYPVLQVEQEHGAKGSTTDDMVSGRGEASLRNGGGTPSFGGQADSRATSDSIMGGRHSRESVPMADPASAKDYALTTDPAPADDASFVAPPAPADDATSAASPASVAGHVPAADFASATAPAPAEPPASAAHHAPAASPASVAHHAPAAPPASAANHAPAAPPAPTDPAPTTPPVPGAKDNREPEYVPLPVPGREPPEAFAIVSQKPNPVVRPRVPGERRHEQDRPRRAPVEHPRTQRTPTELAVRPRTQRQTSAANKRSANRVLPIALLVAAVVIIIGLVGSWSFVQVQHATQEAKNAKSADAAANETDAATRSTPMPNDIPPSETPQQVAPVSEFEQKVQSGEYRSVRLIGDSITAGYATDDYEDPDLVGTSKIIYDDGEGGIHYETTPEAKCWASDFRMWATGHGMTSFTNAGISGSFMQELAENPSAWIQEGADVIVVALGTNDAGYYGAQEYEQAARTALEAVEQSCKQVIVIAPVDDLRPEEMVVQPASEFGGILQRICEERGYLFVDPRAAVTPNLFDPDGLHPNTQGSHAIWECIRQTLGLS
ncbi:MAG: SGNH/GDSL hydrolase family protein [Atopobiaceae bacterium]|nr:SGNH/GDSL hydrolase family protein [Atopobiaceae bacterium]